MYNRKLTDEQALEIMHSREKGVVLALKYGISESMVCKIRRKKARAGDLEGRPTTALAGIETGTLPGFPDRLDREFFRKLGLCALYVEERQDGTLRIGVSEAAWMAVQGAEKRGSTIHGVFWVVDKRLALRLRKEISPALEYATPLNLMKILRDLARHLSIFMEDHATMLTRIGLQRRMETGKIVKKFGV